jgi:hypothetical protein
MVKPAPVTVACEIVIVAVPVLLNVRVFGLVVPVLTLPKSRVAVLAASVPNEVEFAADVPAPVRPTHPESDTTAKVARIRAIGPSSARRWRFAWARETQFVCEIMTKRD